MKFLFIFAFYKMSDNVSCKLLNDDDFLFILDNEENIYNDFKCKEYNLEVNCHSALRNFFMLMKEEILMSKLEVSSKKKCKNLHYQHILLSSIIIFDLLMGGTNILSSIFLCLSEDVDQFNDDQFSLVESIDSVMFDNTMFRVSVEETIDRECAKQIFPHVLAHRTGLFLSSLLSDVIDPRELYNFTMILRKFNLFLWLKKNRMLEEDETTSNVMDRIKFIRYNQFPAHMQLIDEKIDVKAIYRIFVSLESAEIDFFKFYDEFNKYFLIEKRDTKNKIDYLHNLEKQINETHDYIQKLMLEINNKSHFYVTTIYEFSIINILKLESLEMIDNYKYEEEFVFGFIDRILQYIRNIYFNHRMSYNEIFEICKGFFANSGCFDHADKKISFKKIDMINTKLKNISFDNIDYNCYLFIKLADEYKKELCCVFTIDYNINIRHKIQKLYLNVESFCRIGDLIKTSNDKIIDLKGTFGYKLYMCKIDKNRVEQIKTINDMIANNEFTDHKVNELHDNDSFVKQLEDIKEFNALYDQFKSKIKWYISLESIVFYSIKKLCCWNKNEFINKTENSKLYEKQILENTIQKLMNLEFDNIYDYSKAENIFNKIATIYCTNYMTVLDTTDKDVKLIITKIYPSFTGYDHVISIYNKIFNIDENGSFIKLIEKRLNRIAFAADGNCREKFANTLPAKVSQNKFKFSDESKVDKINLLKKQLKAFTSFNVLHKTMYNTIRNIYRIIDRISNLWISQIESNEKMDFIENMERLHNSVVFYFENIIYKALLDNNLTKDIIYSEINNIIEKYISFEKFCIRKIFNKIRNIIQTNDLAAYVTTEKEKEQILKRFLTYDSKGIRRGTAIRDFHKSLDVDDGCFVTIDNIIMKFVQIAKGLKKYYNKPKKNEIEEFSRVIGVIECEFEYFDFFYMDLNMLTIIKNQHAKKRNKK